MNLTSDAHQEQNELLFAGFNQDAGCFSCGTANGFVIYNVDPFRETFRRIFPNGGIGMVEMLFRCNLLALVGGGRNPRYPTNKVMIWDDHQNKCIGELKFRTEVRAVKLRRDRIVVVLDAKVFVYRFKDLKLMDSITTVPNPKGLVSLCSEAKNNVLAIPGLQRGSIRIELYDIAKATLIKAHDAELAQFALNSDGSRIASASEKGTLIRIWNCHTGEPMRELRRGVDRADIYCICFNQTSSHVACSSDKGTVHLFSLAAPPVRRAEPASYASDGGQDVRLSDVGASGKVSGKYDPIAVTQQQSSQQQSSQGSDSPSTADNSNASNKSMTGIGINFLKGFLPTGLVPKYFESEWSFGQVRGIEGRSICAFSKDSSKIHVICADGNFVVAAVEEGECTRLSTMRFMKNDDELRQEDQDA